MTDFWAGRPIFWVNLPKRSKIRLIFAGFFVGFSFSEINIFASCLVQVAELQLQLQEEKTVAVARELPLLSGVAGANE
jgi:hypothetical protein